MEYRKLLKLKFSNSCLLSVSLSVSQCLDINVNYPSECLTVSAQSTSQTEAVPGLTRAQLPSELEPGVCCC